MESEFIEQKGVEAASIQPLTTAYLRKFPRELLQIFFIGINEKNSCFLLCSFGVITDLNEHTAIRFIRASHSVCMYNRLRSHVIPRCMLQDTFFRRTWPRRDSRSGTLIRHDANISIVLECL